MSRDAERVEPEPPEPQKPLDLRKFNQEVERIISEAWRAEEKGGEG